MLRITSSLLWRETFILFFKAVHYINIFDKIVWKKRQAGPCSQDVQKCETHGELPAIDQFFHHASSFVWQNSAAVRFAVHVA